ncbi:uncharacterized protein [Typha angustifolia]|uniref:uncharacterized protein n=1 Tax=Typha angustifolia TaxID=59011 RepID=UPI003C2DD53F
MESLFAQLSDFANQALDDKHFDPSKIESLLAQFGLEASSSFAAAAAEHEKASSDAEISMREAEASLESLVEASMADFDCFYDALERSAAAAAPGRSEKYVDSAMEAAIADMGAAFAASKIYPS